MERVEKVKVSLYVHIYSTVLLKHVNSFYI